MSALVPVTVACIMAAAQIQSVPPAALVTILSVEGGRIGHVSRNSNGSSDLGPMQINDKVWAPIVADMHFDGDKEKAVQALRDNGCYNIHIGAWILKQQVDHANGDLVEGIGLYHSHTKKHKEKYKGYFIKRFQKIFGNPRNQ